MDAGVDDAQDVTWDRTVDVVVVGMGAAGSAAAVEAAERGATVLALDRWGRGGASARSGGVVYAGGGTPQQHAAGFEDDPACMERYLDLEEEVAQGDDLVHRFCARSRDDLAWLESMGARVAPHFDGRKAIVPTEDDVGLYFSGNEKHFGYRTPAVARGHRIAGAGMTGYALVEALHAEAARRGVEILRGARLVRLVTSATGAVDGVEIQVLRDDRATRLAHGALFRLQNAAGTGLRRVPRWLTRATDGIEARRGSRRFVRARRGVVLATGGFSYNHAMMERYAPDFARTMPLGTAGDDGSGIVAAQAAGAAVRLMDRCGASRFYAPPVAFCSGILVDADGERICDESLYAATLSAHIAEHGGRAWLVVDERAVREARREILQSPTLRGRRLADIVRSRENHLVFPWLFGGLNLTLNRRRAPTVVQLATRCGLPAEKLENTVAAYDAMAEAGGPDPLGKPAAFLRPLERGRLSAVRCDLDSQLFPAPCITLGGLDVDAGQAVRRPDGSIIPGLYAVGRCAAGVASRSYVSGLSLADCVFSGRNAGASVTAA